MIPTCPTSCSPCALALALVLALVLVPSLALALAFALALVLLLVFMFLLLQAQASRSTCYSSIYLYIYHCLFKMQINDIIIHNSQNNPKHLEGRLYLGLTMEYCKKVSPYWLIYDDQFLHLHLVSSNKRILGASAWRREKIFSCPHVNQALVLAYALAIGTGIKILQLSILDNHIKPWYSIDELIHQSETENCHLFMEVLQRKCGPLCLERRIGGVLCQIPHYSSAGSCR